MKLLREHIKKEIIKLAENQTLRKYKAPPIIANALHQLFPGDLNRYIENTKAAATIPPSYRIFLKGGGKYFDLVIIKSPQEEMGLSVIAKIGAKRYNMTDITEVKLAQQELDRLLRAGVFSVDGDEETDDSDDTGGGSDSDTAFDDDGEDEEEETDEA
tara:strand:+ start:35 stop:508 length:474 start_codon:yes stop_codon:yes gene_type:complete